MYNIYFNVWVGGGVGGGLMLQSYKLPDLHYHFYLQNLWYFRGGVVLLFISDLLVESAKSDFRTESIF